MKRVSNYEARNVIARREEFNSHTGNFSGRTHTPGRYVYTGYLPGRLKGTDSVSEADYIVFSYSTPIAWHIPGEGWVVPPASYSITTSHHQSVARIAASGDYSPRHLRSPWEIGVPSGRATELLSAVRHGNNVTRQKGQRRAPFEAVVATGEARWSEEDAETIVPA